MYIRNILLCNSVFTLFFITSVQSAFCPWPRGNYVNYAHPTWPATCNVGGTDFTCATWDGVEQECNGYVPAGEHCGTGQYRDYNDCKCYNCPSGTGSICTIDRPCCSLNDCSREHMPMSSPTPLVVTTSLSSSTSQCASKIFICTIVGSILLVLF